MQTIREEKRNTKFKREGVTERVSVRKERTVFIRERRE